jgi:hypothetical protein
VAGSADIDNLGTNESLIREKKSPLDDYNRIKRDSEEKISKKLNNLRREF